MANIYKRGATWWGRGQKGGQEFRKSLKTQSERVAHARLAEWIKELDRIAWGVRPRVTVNEACHRFLTEHAITLRERSAKRYLISLRHFDEQFGTSYVDKITKVELREFEAARRSGGASAPTVRRDLAALSSVFSFLIEHELADQNPVSPFLRQRKKRGLREAPPRTRYLTHDEEKALLAQCGPQVRAAVLFAIYTGLRQQEQFGLTWEQINLVKGEIFIPGEIAKGKRDRNVVMLPQGREIAQAIPRNIRSNYVFCHGTGARYRHLDRGFRGAAKRAGLRSIRWHDLRRTHGCRLIQDWNWSMEMVRDQLGHTTLAQTERSYAFLEVEHRHARIRAVAQMSAQGSGSGEKDE